MAGVKGQRSGGHNAKSAREHRIEGTYRADRHAHLETLAPPKGRPTPPRPLAGAELAEWERMCDRLEHAGTLSIVDDAALFEYVQLFAEVHAIPQRRLELAELAAKLKGIATEKLGDGPELVAALNRIAELERLISACDRQLRQGHMALKQFQAEFGMTPASRRRVQPIAADDDPAEDKKSTHSLARLQQRARVVRFSRS